MTGNINTTLKKGLSCLFSDASGLENIVWDFRKKKGINRKFTSSLPFRPSLVKHCECAVLSLITCVFTGIGSR